MDDSLSDDSIFNLSSPGASPNAESSPTSDSLFTNTAYTGPGFTDGDMGTWLRTASPDERDRAPFGIIEVDREGTIVFYNETEARYADVAPEEAEGKNFFTEVAPCTDNGTFRGRFEQQADSETVDDVFRYVLTYQYAPTTVTVRLVREEGRSWILMRPEDDTFRGLDDDAQRQPFG